MTSTSRNWPEKPFSLITSTTDLKSIDRLPSDSLGRSEAVRVARLMAQTHNTIFRAFNAIYNQADSIDPSNKRDVTSFTTFATFAIDFLENHHRCEELVFFPMLEAQAGIPGMMANDVKQHRAFEEPLAELRDYLRKVHDGTDTLDAAVLRTCIDILAPELERHLRDEIPSILAAGVHLSDDAMAACYKALHDEAEGTTDPFKIGPLVMGCQDNTLLLDGLHIQFPQLPFRFAPHLVHLIVSRRYADVWRFCPSTFFGEPRDTEFSTPKVESGCRKASTEEKFRNFRVAALRQLLTGAIQLAVLILVLNLMLAACRTWPQELSWLGRYLVVLE
ncbi:hypothetical protein B0T16DRAFT_457274 [Cercophora newfieldiana]|uniref:Hemerythrin-like domain-containing protein n=1 Tax=Cercophora newfieldiana TaxID=92897 RepID=A0AA40CSI8_9PEZI|nr:hypothetical protein B0T16DRAFT_457274 [Cercophora newfieldiana]